MNHNITIPTRVHDKDQAATWALVSYNHHEQTVDVTNTQHFARWFDSHSDAEQWKKNPRLLMGYSRQIDDDFFLVETTTVEPDSLTLEVWEAHVQHVEARNMVFDFGYNTPTVIEHPTPYDDHRPGFEQDPNVEWETPPFELNSQAAFF